MPRRLLAGLLALAAAGCGGFRKVNIFTVPQELAIGEVFSSEVESYYPVLHDPYIDWWLNHRGRMLVDLSDRRDIPYTFNVIDSPELNAFAIPGGHIYVNLGMIEAAESEAELLGVVAHEIGHVLHKHSMKSLSQESIVNIVGTIALNQYPNQWAALAANLFGATGFLKMSRDAERESDATGVELLVRAGYEPAEMGRMYEKLLRKYDEEPGLLDKLFSTHPPTRERIDNIAGMVSARQPLPDGLVKTTPEFQAMYDRVVREYYTEPGRRRWRDVIKEKEDEQKKEEDRLPWDRKKDEEKRREKEKEKERERRDRERRGEEPAPTPGPAPPPEEPGPDPSTRGGEAR